jgi:hypothetical protein
MSTQAMLDVYEEHAVKYNLDTIIRDLEKNPNLYNDDDYIKVNLPDTLAKFRSGNGEGIWAVPYTKNDIKICASNNVGTRFKVVVFNDCIYYPFRMGDIIQVEIIDEDQRPILDKEWLDKNKKLRKFYE